ncbi:hypothetical protein CASFOL_001041 [Castilleja foliolosa]|uniref:Uncharacterized protein n=1 Tax=Castilleja foliolosa TaxID=1961234 RepID=A0ABD3EQ93_9LAMI
MSRDNGDLHFVDSLESLDDENNIKLSSKTAKDNENEDVKVRIKYW